jgi:hypothetical protein
MREASQHFLSHIGERQAIKQSSKRVLSLAGDP